MRPRKRSGISVREIEGETVVLDRCRNKVHVLNPTASFVWDRCDGGLTEAEIAAQLAEAYDVEPARARSDVTAILQQLGELGLVESSD